MLLELIDISKGYGARGSHAFRQVLEGLNWSVDIGGKVGIEGPSGSGKTTLLNIAGGLDQPDCGRVIFKNKIISTHTPDELARFRNRELGFIFQQHLLLPQFTLLENVLLPVLPLKKRVSAEDRNWAEHLLKKLGIWDIRNQRPGEMSGGENQRAAVVRALINKPGLVLADEPTGALDEKNATGLGELMVSVCDSEGITLVIVTHAKELAARMDRIFHLRDGKLIS